jgi:hypothetical protein
MRNCQSEKSRYFKYILERNFLKMKASELQLAKNPDLIASVAAIKRAAQLARQTAIQTNTAIVVIKDGVLCRISAEELKQQALT